MNKLTVTIVILIFAIPAELRSTAGASDVSRYRTNQVDARARQIPDDIQRGIFTDPERYVEPLVTALTQDIDDDFHRVKIIHDWVADNIAYDVESYTTGARTESGWAATLKQRKNVCEGYGTLFQKMCQVAEIPCAKISGYGRGYRFTTGRDQDVNQSNHAWNAVKINDRWYLVDTTWDAGHIDTKGYHKSFSHAYLFLDPADFLYTHFPQDRGWQLLKQPVSAQQFSNLPYLKGRFFQHGMRLASKLNRVTRAGESVQFSLRIPDDVLILASLKDAAGKSRQRRTLIQRENEVCRVFITFPSSGRWKVYVHCKRRSDEGSYWQAGVFEFAAARGTSRTFPRTFSNYNELDGYLYSPLYVPLGTSKPQLFKVRVKKTSEVHLVSGSNRWQKLEPSQNEDGVFHLTATVAAGQPVRLIIRKPSDEKSYETLVDFTPGQR